MTTVNTLLSGGQGVAVPTGFVGEIVTASKSDGVTQSISASTWTNINLSGGSAATLSIGAGTWLISAICSLGGNISTASDSKNIAISAFSGATTTDQLVGTNQIAATTPGITYDGVATLVFTQKYTTAQTLYLKVTLGVSASTAVFRYNMTAIRLA